MKKSRLTIDEHNVAQCTCGVVGFEVTFNDDRTEAIAFECISCGEVYSTMDVERAKTVKYKPTKKVKR